MFVMRSASILFENLRKSHTTTNKRAMKTCISRAAIYFIKNRNVTFVVDNDAELAEVNSVSAARVGYKLCVTRFIFGK